MNLLITQSEFQSHSGLPGVTGSHTNHVINGTDYIHCEITNQNGFDQIESSLNSNNYQTGDGILLPPEAFEK